ncbi:MAG: ribokinase [Rhizobiales bacterium]|nr:ribokinase [Hyphomicrobiales bacterium]
MILVFGSINIDLVTRVARIPAPGETVLGSTYEMIPGGKGANQALAAARAGAKVALIGAVGQDAYGDLALALLRAGDVDLSGVRAVDEPTGAAFIAVDAQGRNAIVVASGANRALRAGWIDDARWGGASTLLLQREGPPADTLEAAREAKARGLRVVMNAAPADGFDPALLAHVDVLIVNEHEAVAVAEALGWLDRAPGDVARRLDAEKNVATVATLGGEGAILWSGGVMGMVRPPAVAVADTTAAGDSFVGAFAAALDEGATEEVALRRGVAAGSLACVKAGAQPSIPYRNDIDKLVGGLG